MVDIVCIVCGECAEVDGRGRPDMCGYCAMTHLQECWRACAAVNRAVARGQLPKANTLACADCGEPAKCYDHRDYTKPLDVQPVCGRCNSRRGHAFNSFYRESA